MAGLARRLLLCLAALLAVLYAAPAPAAPNVTPSDRVIAAVVVRADATAQSGALARLRPGEMLVLDGEVPGWYRVILPDGRTGYVSKGWTDVVPETQVTTAPTWRVHFVDVSTGLATFVEGPDFALVYDGGSNDDLARGPDNRFLAYIRRVRPDLQVIDHLILSHPHRDHVELLPDLFDAYEIRNVWDPGRLYDNCGYRAFLQKVQAEPGVTYHDAHGSSSTVHHAALGPRECYQAPVPALDVSIPHGPPIVRGLVIPLGAQARMTFLHADSAPYSNENENSVVVRLDLGTNRLLFTGDAEAGGREGWPDTIRADSIEGQLLSCCADAIRANLLVAGHHGSRTSSRRPFLDAVGATVFVISSGPHKYQSVTLPDPIVEQTLSGRGELWQTDFDDDACRIDTAKIGPDDRKPGGCDNILVRVPASGPPLINYERIHD